MALADHCLCLLCRRLSLTFLSWWSCWMTLADHYLYLLCRRLKHVSVCNIWVSVSLFVNCISHRFIVFKKLKWNNDIYKQAFWEYCKKYQVRYQRYIQSKISKLNFDLQLSETAMPVRGGGGVTKVQNLTIRHISLNPWAITSWKFNGSKPSSLHLCMAKQCTKY
jgi:hypothetical protein